MKTTTVTEDIEHLLADAEKTSRASSTLAEARKMWTGIRDGARYDAESLVHIATLLACDFHRVLILAVKYKCECLLAQAMAPSESKTPPRGEATTGRQTIKKRLVLDSDTLFQILRKYGHVPNGLAYDPSSLAETVREIILLDGHLMAIHSPELQAFAERSRRALAVLQQCTADITEQYNTKKSQWLDVQDQIGEQLLYCEKLRLRNESATQEWLVRFGENYLLAEQQRVRIDGLRQRIALKLAQPELTREALEQLVREAESSRNAALRTLRSRLAIASMGVIYRAGEEISPDELSNYRRQSKALLRNIWLLLHPDTLSHHPQYGQLTERQKTRLSELWHRAMAIREYELGMEPGCVGTDHRSLVALQDILSTVKSILAESGLDTDVRLIIRGETVEDQLTWLQHSIERLEHELDVIHIELVTLINDPVVQGRMNDLDRSPVEQAERNDELLAGARTSCARADELERQLQQLFTTPSNES